MDQASFSRQLDRGFDAGEVSAHLTPGASPVHVLTSEVEHPEYRFLRSERIAGGPVVVAAQAGDFGYALIQNPTGSGAICVVQDLVALNRGAAAADYHVRMRSVAGISAPTTIKAALWDSRYPNTSRSAVDLGYRYETGGVTLGNLIGRMMVPAGDQRTWRGPIVLTPGFWVGLILNVVNTETCATFRWWERPMEPGETAQANP